MFLQYGSAAFRTVTIAESNAFIVIEYLGIPALTIVTERVKVRLGVFRYPVVGSNQLSVDTGIRIRLQHPRVCLVLVGQEDRRLNKFHLRATADGPSELVGDLGGIVYSRLLVVVENLLKSHQTLEEVGISHTAHDRRASIHDDCISRSILRQCLAERIRRVRDLYGVIRVFPCGVDIKLDDIHRHVGVGCETMRSPKGKELLRQRFHIFNRVEVALLIGCSIVEGDTQIINQNPQLVVAPFIGLACLFHGFFITVLQTRAFEQGCQVILQILGQCLRALFIESLIRCTRTLPKTVRRIHGLVVLNIADDKFVTFLVKQEMGIVVKYLLRDASTMTAQCKHTEVADEESVDVSLYNLCACQIHVR